LAIGKSTNKNMKWPDFFLVGAMKAGTTSLHSYLSAHPDISMSEPKEPGYFSRDDRFKKGTDWYQSHFSSARVDQIWGDSSTCYSRRPIYKNSADRIYDVNPHAKILYIVRDPVLRAYSHYKHRMEEAIVSGAKTVTYKEFLASDDEILISGKYYYQIKKYYDLFGRKNVHICNFDDLIKDPTIVMDYIHRFLDIKVGLPVGEIAIHNNSSGSSLLDSAANQIIDTYRHNPMIKLLVYLMPIKLRRYGRNYIKSMVHSSDKFKRKSLHSIKSLPYPDSEDVDFLAKYYREDLISLKSIVDIDMSPWFSFR